MHFWGKALCMALKMWVMWVQSYSTWLPFKMYFSPVLLSVKSWWNCRLTVSEDFDQIELWIFYSNRVFILLGEAHDLTHVARRSVQSAKSLPQKIFAAVRDGTWGFWVKASFGLKKTLLSTCGSSPTPTWGVTWGPSWTTVIRVPQSHL